MDVKVSKTTASSLLAFAGANVATESSAGMGGASENEQARSTPLQVSPKTNLTLPDLCGIDLGKRKAGIILDLTLEFEALTFGIEMSRPTTPKGPMEFTHQKFSPPDNAAVIEALKRAISWDLRPGRYEQAYRELTKIGLLEEDHLNPKESAALWSKMFDIVLSINPDNSRFVARRVQRLTFDLIASNRGSQVSEFINKGLKRYAGRKTIAAVIYAMGRLLSDTSLGSNKERLLAPLLKSKLLEIENIEIYRKTSQVLVKAQAYDFLFDLCKDELSQNNQQRMDRVAVLVQEFAKAEPRGKIRKYHLEHGLSMAADHSIEVQAMIKKAFHGSDEDSGFESAADSGEPPTMPPESSPSDVDAPKPAAVKAD
jgi:hypothetical protein